MAEQDMTDLTISVAAESETVQTHFAEAVQDSGSGSAEDAQAAFDHARESAAHEEAAQAAHDAQASYLAQGDIAHAQEMNVTVVHEYAAADVGGTAAETQFVQAQQEGTNLDNASWHENAAAQHLQDAQIAMNSGDADHAAQYTAMAGTSASSAVDYASHGDGDHSYDAHVDATPSYDASHDTSHDTSSYDSSHADTSHVDTTGSDAPA